jgi:hypothetical protein
VSTYDRRRRGELKNGLARALAWDNLAMYADDKMKIH